MLLTENEILAHNESDEHLNNFIEFFKNGGKVKENNVTKFEYNSNSKIVKIVGDGHEEDDPMNETIKFLDLEPKSSEPELVIGKEYALKKYDQFTLNSS